jgi:hypothetical protein
MPSQTELSDPNRDRRNALVIFYAAAAVCGAAGTRAAATAPHGRHYLYVAVIALATLSALVALWSLVHILRAADELQRRINHQALAFAFVGTLVVCLVYGFLQQTGLRCVSWLGVCALLVALWSLGLILFSRRYQ